MAAGDVTPYVTPVTIIGGLGNISLGNVTINTSGLAQEGGGNLTIVATNTGSINTATGTQADTAYVSGSGSLIALLKGIFGKFSSILTTSPQVGGSNIAATNPVPVYSGYQATSTANWTTGTAVNTALTSTTAGYSTVIVTLVESGDTGGVLVFEVYDGATWLAVKAPSIIDYTTTGATIPLSGTVTKGYQVPVAGFPQFRVRLSTALTAGTLLVTSVVSAVNDTSIVTVGLDPSQPLPAGNNPLGNVSISNQILNTTVAPQLVVSGTASAVSGTVSSTAKFIVINPTIDSWVNIGSAPTATAGTAGNIFMAAGTQSYPFSVTPSVTKVAAITNNASAPTGYITITEGQ